MKRLFFVLVVLVGLLTAASRFTMHAETTDSLAVRLRLPIAVNDTAITAKNTVVDIDVLANDSNTNNLLHTVISSVEEPAHGTAVRNLNGTFDDETDDFIRYTPDNGFEGIDQFSYTVIDEFGGRDEAMVTVFINVPPDAKDDVARVSPGATIVIDVLDNDVDDPDDELTIEAIIVGPKNGTATITTPSSKLAGTAADEVITYVAKATFPGKDSLRYVVSDGKAGRDSAWVRINANQRPVAVDDDVLTQAGMAVDVEVLSNDSDPENDAFAIESINQAPTNGTAQIMTDEIRYTPNAGFNGLDELRYVILDDLGGRDTARVALDVNGPPIAEDDEASTLLETALDIDVLANDSDPEDNPLSIDAITDAPSGGTAQIVSAGQRIRYTPSTDFIGTDEFTYRVVDGRGGSAEATVEVTIIAEAMMQFIHNAPDLDFVDVYYNDVRIIDDFEFQSATPYLVVQAGNATIDLTASTATSNANPLVRIARRINPTETYVAIAQGVVADNLTVRLVDDARLTATLPNEVEFFFVHGVPDAGRLDLRQLDPEAENLPVRLLANSIAFGDVTDYQSIDAGFQNLDLTNFDNTEIYDAYRFNFNPYAGETFVLLSSGLLADGSITVVGYDVDGDPIPTDIVTATDETAELPTEFALKGNYPNPFNPSTTIRFDLPAPATVTVEVVDILGRQVLTVPGQQVDAGANRGVAVDASSLASGTYLYRIIARAEAETFVRSGRMTLVK